jgi:hypothetical protein
MTCSHELNPLETCSHELQLHRSFHSFHSLYSHATYSAVTEVGRWSLRTGSFILFFALGFSFIFDTAEQSRDRIFVSATMVEDLERQAIEAFKEDEFEQAVDFYTQAIRLDPSNAGFYVDRAWANIKLENFTGRLETGTFWCLAHNAARAF